MFASRKMTALSFDGNDLHWVDVKKNLRGFELTHWMTLRDVHQRDPLALHPDIDDFFRRARADKNQSVVALPRSMVVLRLLQFPRAVLENLTNIVEYQVENYEPIDRAELSYAHQLVDEAAGRRTSPWGKPVALWGRSGTGKGPSPGPQSGAGKLNVLLAMARRSDVERNRSFLASLGVHPRAMLCESLGLVRLMQLDEAAARENSFLVRTGENDFELIAVLSGKIRCAKRFDHASNDPKARSEQVTLEIDRARAELQLEKKDVHNAFLTGSEPEKLLNELRAHEGAMPWRLLRIPGSLRSRANATEFHALAPAIGVAILAITKGGLATDLLGQGEGVTQPRWTWAPTYALCGLAVLMIGAGAARPYYQQAQFLRQLNAEIERLQPQVRQVERLETTVSEIQKKAAILENLQGRDARNLEALRELSEILPDTTWINEFNLRGDGIEIGGFADNATALVPLIGQSPLFKEVTLASGIARTQQGKEIFRIRAKFGF